MRSGEKVKLVAQNDFRDVSHTPTNAMCVGFLMERFVCSRVFPRRKDPNIKKVS